MILTYKINVSRTPEQNLGYGEEPDSEVRNIIKKNLRKGRKTMRTVTLTDDIRASRRHQKAIFSSTKRNLTPKWET